MNQRLGHMTWVVKMDDDDEVDEVDDDDDDDDDNDGCRPTHCHLYEPRQYIRVQVMLLVLPSLGVVHR